MDYHQSQFPEERYLIAINHNSKEFELKANKEQVKYREKKKQRDQTEHPFS
jgi:hypothetical protein